MYHFSMNEKFVNKVSDRGTRWCGGGARGSGVSLRRDGGLTQYGGDSQSETDGLTDTVTQQSFDCHDVNIGGSLKEMNV